MMMKAISTLVAMLAVALYFLREPVFYYNDIFSLLTDGEAAYQARMASQGKSEPLSMFNALVYTSTAEIKKRLQEYGDDKKEIGSGNFLGAFVMNPNAMSHGTIALGADVAAHTRVRPFLDNLLWGKDQNWDEKDIEADVRAFLKDRKELHIRDDLTLMVVRILFNRWLGDNMTLEEVKAFKQYQSSRLMVSILPEWTKYFMSGTLQTVNKQHEFYLSRITTLLEGHPGLGAASAHEAAWGALDALTFAGGLGAPTLIHHCVAVLANKEAGQDFKLSSDNVDLFIMETSRLYPAVSEIPYLRNGKREIAALGSASQEKKVWGSDAKQFKLRSLPLYHENLSAFGEFAGPNRMCPGKSLTLSIVRSFLLAITKMEFEGPKEKVKPSGYDFASFTIKF